MTSPPLGEQIGRRTAMAGVQLDGDDLARLVDYYALLERWNQKINLTALPLAARADSTIDRLVVEPLVALHEFDAKTELAWMDFGSGGGSPALPIKILRPRTTLTMVESRERKSAFLREAVSSLGLHEAVVETCRIEELVRRHVSGSVDIITMRAVRLQADVLNVARALLKAGGRLVLFRGESTSLQLEGFDLAQERPLTPSVGFLSTFIKNS